MRTTTNDSLRVVATGADHVDALAALGRAATLDPDDARRWSTALQLGEEDDHFVLVLLTGRGEPEVVGALAAGASRDLDGKGDAEIYRLIVDPRARRRGHGRALAAAAMERLDLAGFGAITCTVATPMGAAFFRALGWREDPCRGPRADPVAFATTSSAPRWTARDGEGAIAATVNSSR